MQQDFHYYATYCAAILAGFSHEESTQIGYAAEFTDHCTATLLADIKGPASAATTQTKMELVNSPTTPVDLQNMTRIWSSFHFLPYDVNADYPGGHRSKSFLKKYRLICKPNGTLVPKTVEQAKKIGTLQSIGIAMHVVADTWAHAYFAGTPSLVINNVPDDCYEIIEQNGKDIERKINFCHKPSAPDDLEKGDYVNSIKQNSENSIMNLGHGRMGHLPDYSFARYKYMPSWADYNIVLKDNQAEYFKAFCQITHAMKYIRGEAPEFKLNHYDESLLAGHVDEIHAIIKKRQLDACSDWKELGQKLSGYELEDFSNAKYKDEYRNASEEEKDKTFLGKYIIAVLAQKSMVTKNVYDSGSRLAGISVDYKKSGFSGVVDYKKLVNLVEGDDNK